MYPRNAASPEPIAIGAVVQISDGAVQTSGCTVRIKPVGVAEGDGAGTTAYSTDGIVLYTPTQAETNYTSFILIAKKASCIPVSITVVTSASATAGNAGLDWGAIINKTTTNALTNTTISTSQTITSVSGSVGSVTGAVGSVTGTAAIATAVWQDSTAGDFTVANSIGKCLYIANIVPGGSGGLMISGTNAGTITFGALTVTGATTLTGAVSAANASNDVRGVTLLSTGLSNVTTWTVNITGSLSGSVGSVTGAVGSVTGAVTISAGSVDAIWDEDIVAAHTTADTAGKKLATAGSAADPWDTSLPGAYAAGKAGYILGTNLDAVLTARTLAAASYFDPATDTVANVTTVGSVTGAVGSVTGSVGSVVGITASQIGDTYNAVLQLKYVTVANSGLVVTGTSPTQFTTDMTFVTDAFVDALIGFSSGTLAGQYRPITSMNSGTGVITVSEAFTGTPSTNDPVYIKVTHVHPISQIASGVWQDTTSGDFTVASSIGKSLYTSGAVPGANGGLFIAGSNAATTVNITGSLSGSVGSVTGAVGSVTGAVTISAGSVDAIWDEDIVAAHTTADTAGKKLATAGSVTDPWDTALPGAYTAGKAGYILGTNLDAVLTARTLASASYFDPATDTVANVTTVGSVSGAVGSVTGNVGGNVVGTVASVVTKTGYSLVSTGLDLVTAWMVDITGSLSGAVGSVSGAVGSVTGNVGGNVNGNVVGSTASVSGAVGSVTGNIGGNLAGSVLGNVSGSVGSVTGAVGSVAGSVGSVTGNVGGSVASVTGSVGSVVGNVSGDVAGKVLGGGSGTIAGDGVRAASVTGATGSVTGSVGSVVGFTASNVATIMAVTNKVDTMLVLDGAVYQFTANAVELTPSGGASASEVADAVWDELLSGHVTVGSAGAALTAAGSAGDPWATAQPGAYAAGTFGYLISTTTPALLQAALTAASAVVPETAGTITGFPETLRIGDSYVTALNTYIKVYVRDSDANPLTAIGTKNFTDADFEADLTVTQGSRTSLVTATCTWVPAAGPVEGYLKVEFPTSQTRRATEGGATMQLVFRWTDVESTIATQDVQWLARTNRTVQ